MTKKETVQNLKPFKKGTTGNPKGRPKKLPDIDTLLADVLGSEDDDKSEAKAVIKSLLTQAKKGNVRAIEVLLDRAYGKAKQTVDQNVNVKEFSLKDIVKFK
jgi:hypothetical protein